MRRVAALPTIALSLATACATAASTGRATAGSASPLQSSAVVPRAPLALATRDMIPRRTLDMDPGLSLYDVVGRYWPQVLRPQSASPGLRLTTDPRGDIVGVYVDDTFAGGQEQLRSIRSSAVSSIRRLTTSEEFIRYGRSHAGGALVITFR